MKTRMFAASFWSAAFAMLAVFCTPSTPLWADAEKPKLAVITEGKIGFSSGADVFHVGMPAAEFVKRFGQPEGKYVDELCYYSKGIEVAVDPVAKTIKQMTFFYAAVDYTDVGGGKFKPASVATDKGISAGASREEIVKAHGKPTSEEPEIGGTATMEYPWGRFYFKHGKLVAVEIQRSEK